MISYFKKNIKMMHKKASRFRRIKVSIKIGISGFGRIGRVVFRAAMEDPEIEIAGVNVRNADIEYMVYMLI